MKSWNLLASSPLAFACSHLDQEEALEPLGFLANLLRFVAGLKTFFVSSCCKLRLYRTIGSLTPCWFPEPKQSSLWMTSFAQLEQAGLEQAGVLKPLGSFLDGVVGGGWSCGGSVGWCAGGGGGFRVVN